MVFTSAWDQTKPAGSRNLNLGDDDIREFKQQVQERADIDGYFPSSDDAKTGYHRKATLIEQASDPSQVADTVILYSKLVGSYSELHSRHENAAAQQLTLNGKLWVEGLTIASIAQGDIFYYDGTKVTRLGPGTSGYFLKTQGAAANPVWADAAVPVAASQAEMEAASSNTVFATPGRTKNHPGVAKAWCTFDGTSGSPTVIAGHNVASVSVLASNYKFRITFTTAMSAATYGVAICTKTAGWGYIDAVATTHVDIITRDHTGFLNICDIVSVVIFGDFA